MSHSAKAANRIKQEAGFPSCFPDEAAVFNSEELYNSKSKHDSNSLLLSRKCNIFFDAVGCKRVFGHTNISSRSTLVFGFLRR